MPSKPGTIWNESILCTKLTHQACTPGITLSSFYLPASKHVPAEVGAAVCIWCSLQDSSQGGQSTDVNRFADLWWALGTEQWRDLLNSWPGVNDVRVSPRNTFLEHSRWAQGLSGAGGSLSKRVGNARAGARESNSRFCECGRGWNPAGNRPFWSSSIPSCKAVVWHCVRNPWSMLAGQINGLARLRPVLTLHAIVATFMHDGGFRFSSQL